MVDPRVDTCLLLAEYQIRPNSDHMEAGVPIVGMLKARLSLSRLVEAIETGREREIILARNGRPAAKLVSLDTVPARQRIGVARGACEVPDDIDVHNDEVARLFEGGTQP